ncbi:MAG: hypothetical protein K6U87_03285 [Firmicutes bacterium]|nr:hypothetical protein [Bacillota bacterium]
MNLITMNECSHLYECYEHFEVYTHRVVDDELKRFWHIISHLSSQVGDDKGGILASVVSTLRYYRFLLAVLPIPSANERLLTPHDYEDTLRRLIQVPRFYPALQLTCEDLIQRLDRLRHRDESPLLRATKGLVQDMDSESPILLLPKPRLAHIFEPLAYDVLETHVRVLHPYALRKSNVYDRAVAIGSPQWFPQYIFRSPRIRNLQLVVHEWLPAQLPAPWFDREHEPSTIVLTATFQATDDFDWPWNKLVRQEDFESSSREKIDVVPARLIELGDGSTVFLAQDGTAMAIGTDASPPQATLHRIAISALHPGIAIVLRISDSGDHVEAFARQLLGADQYEEMQALQAQWKAPLRVWLTNQGAADTAARLRELGGKGANEHTVRYWAMEQSISPRKYRDFEAVARLVGLPGDPKSFWKNARRLYLAHRRAGLELRRILLESLQHSDLTTLWEQGYLELVMPETGWGNHGAFVVEAIAPKTYYVPISELGRLRKENQFI